jgi:hypothetical protein
MNRLLFIVVVAGCAVSQAEVKNANDARYENLRTVAAFDLSCTADAVAVTCLGTEGAGYCAKAGARGCEKQATYVLVSPTGQPGSQRQWIRE